MTNPSAPAARALRPSTPDSGWTTTVSPDEIASALKGAKSVLIVTHGKPDGDAAGSVLAVARSLGQIGVSAEVWLAGPVPRWLPAIAGPTPLRELAPATAGKPLQTADGRSPKRTDQDICVIVDTGSWTQLADVRPLLEGHAARNIIIDHHLHGDGPIADRRLIETKCASCTELLSRVCTRLLGVADASKLPVSIAAPLYLGLATDTGWFRYSSVTPQTLRLAADLMQAGVDHTDLYRLIEQQDVPGRWRLLGKALSSLELHSIRSKDDAAVMSLTLADFKSSGADQNDTSGFADMVLTVSTVQVSAVITETPVQPGEPPLTKFSLRSKPGPSAIDVNEVCQKIGGGGHARAAGAKARVPLAEAKKALLEALR